MNPSEAAALLVAAGLEADRWESDALHEKVEGWPAGLYMAALAVRDADVPSEAVRRFTGGDQLVTEYVTEEILQSLSADDVDFLLSTAVLKRLSGELCDDVLGIAGSGATLERLASENQFVIPLDHDGEWYRYHHLFGEMLLTEMHARSPRSSTTSPSGRACGSRHAVSSSPRSSMLSRPTTSGPPRSIWRYSPAMLATNRVDTVSLWLDGYTQADIERIPALGVTAAWHSLILGDMASVHRLTAVLEAHEDDVLEDGTPVGGMLDVLRALTRTDGLTAMRDDAARAYEQLPPNNPYRSIVLPGGQRRREPR